MTCIWRDSYFESDDFYQLTLHVLSVIQVPLDIFGTYIIIRKTPKTMEKVKFTMLLLHLTSVWFDICLSILTQPYIIFPASSGYPLGLLRYLGIPMWFMTYMIVTSVFLVGCAVIMFFEERYNHLVRLDSETQSRKVKRIIFYIINYSITLSIMVPSFLDIPSLEVAQKLFLHDFPCFPPSIVNRPGFFTLTTNTNVLVMCMASYLTFGAGQMLFFFIKTSLFLHYTKAYSRRTSLMQKQLFKALSIQALVPLTILNFPCIYMNLSAAMNYVDMILSNISMIWMIAHGIVSTSIMLIVHKSYREATLEITGCRRLMKVITSSVSNSIVVTM